MSNTRSAHKFNLVRTARKYFVSAFVVFSFTAYAIHERHNDADTSALLPTATAAETRQNNAAVPSLVPTLQIPPTDSFDSSAGQTNAFVQPTVTPVPVIPTLPPPTATKASSGQYKDGTYTGSRADAFFGEVQVEATIQGGKLADVQFLEYPSDRRTSVRINNVAVPRLRTEAITAQSAKVDIVSGATLTSRAFMQSLQTALNSARNA
jgi:uncharacterized protein with FMN-binding domain